MLDGLARHLFERDTNVGNLRGSGPPSLNWLFLVECVVVVILVLFYFFYISRLLGIIVSWILRLALWRSTNSYFEIGAVKVSILGGSIQFNDFRYISRNQSLRIVRGHIVWKYWLRHVRSEENKLSEARKPCRIQISLTGAEWFLYNRTPSYDAILDQLGVRDPLPPDEGDDVKCRSSTTSTEKSRDASASVERSQSALLDGEKGTGGHVDNEDRLDSGRSRTDWLLEALPIEVECEKGAVILGNPSTPCILIAGFDTVVGTYSAVKARSALDPYKQVYHFNFRENKVIWRTNPDYVGSMAECGQARLGELADRLSERTLLDVLRRPSDHLSFSAFSDLFRSKLFRTERTSKKKKAEETENRQTAEKHGRSGWTGLPRYQTAADPTAPLLSDASRPSLHPAEYAKVTTLLETREIDMTYYVDVAGAVPSVLAHKNRVAGLETHDVGNGDLSPEWGVDLVIRGGAITYGPWADRQRAKLQQAFIPATFLNGLETPRLRPGDQRLHTALKVFIEFSEGATVRVPTREPSKDWRYDDLDSTQDSVVRPYGWLDVSIGPNSTMTYVLPMVATVAGFDTLLELHLDEIGMSSSVNYAPFLQAPACRIHCGLPSPLVWDAKRVWTVTTRVSKPDISLLRDHVTLLSDVAKDWTSGPPGDYDHFVPFLYELNVEVVDYVVQLYLNDHNIINNPTTPEDNALLSLSGPTLTSRISIPSEGYRAECTQMHFGVDMTDVVLSMALPDWNTHRAFMTEQTRTFASAPELDIAGSYRFYAQAGADNVEKLDLQITSRDVVFKAIGWVIRYLFNLKENYFGGFTHFVTLEEYRHRHERNLQGDPLELKYRPGKTDAFEVTVVYELDGGLLILPQEIYDCQAALVLALPHLQADLRNHDYFMEMALNVGPCRLFEVADSSTLQFSNLSRYYDATTDSIHVDGMEITANRLFGPQPRTATYMCLWSVHVGRTVGSVAPAFLQALSRAAGSAGVTFADSDNCLPPDFAIRPDPDATFLSVTTESFDLAIRGETSASQLTLPKGADLRFDDLASAPFLKHICLEIPLVHAKVLAPLREPCGPWLETAALQADLSVAVGLSTSGWEARAREQLSFIAMQDSLTRRCRFVYGDAQEGAHRAGSLYLPPLEGPFTSYQSSALPPIGKEWSEDSAPTLADMNGDDDDESCTTSDEIRNAALQGDRRLAYASILPLCDRTQERLMKDRDTFQEHRGRADRPRACDWAPAQPGAKARIRDFGAAEFISVPDKRVCVDLRSLGGLRARISPLVCEAVDGLIKDLRIDRRPEHVLDDLYRAYLDECPRVEESASSAFELKLQIPSVEIIAIQDVLDLDIPSPCLDEHHLHRETKQSGPGNSMFAIIRLDIIDAGLSYRDLTVADTAAVSPSSKRTVERVLAGHADQSQLRILRSSPPFAAIPDRPIGTPGLDHDALVLHLRRCEVRVDYTLDRVLIGLVGGSATLDFDGQAAGLLIGSLWSWRTFSDVAGTLSARESDSAMLTRRLLADMAAEGESAGALAVPTFLNRISYLAGASSTTRLDDIWKLLHILRQAHRQSRSPNEQLEFGSARPPVEDRDRFLRAISVHATWDLDVADIQTSAFIRTVFGTGDRVDPVVLPPPALFWVHPIALDWSTQTFEAYFWHEARRTNRLALGPTNALLGSSGVLPGADELNIRARLTLHSVEAQVDRDLLGLVRHIAGVRRTFENRIKRFQATLGPGRGQPPQNRSPSPTSLPWATLPPINLSASTAILSIDAKADAGEVTAQLAGSAIISSVFVHFRPRLEQDGLFTGHSWKVASTFAAEAASLTAAEGSHTSDVLLSASIVSSLHCLWLAGERAANGKLAVDSTRLNLSIGGVTLRVPRDAVRSYQFIDNLRATTLPTYDSLLSELRFDAAEVAEVPKAPVGPTTGTLEAWAGSALSVQVACRNLVVTIQAIATLETSYCLERFSAFADTAVAESQPVVLAVTHGGVHFGRQSVRFVPRLSEAASESTTGIPAETVFDLPIIRAVGRFTQRPAHHLKILATVDPVAITLTAAVLDSILAVQRHFGHDIDELLSTVRARRAAAGSTAPMIALPPTTSSPAIKLSFDVQLAFRGLKLGVQGPQAIQWVGVDLLEGHISSLAAYPRLLCRAFLQDLALSLEQRMDHDGARALEPDHRRRHRLAFFRLDLDADNVPIGLDTPSAMKHVVSSTPSVTMRVPRLEAVLQPASIEALADLIEHFVVEIRLRRQSREAEIELLRTRVISSLDNEAQGPKAASQFASCIFSVQASRIGIAIPLSDEGITGAVATRRKRVRAAQARPAFLLALPSLSFSAQKGSDCDATIAKFSMQFVPDFDQGRIEHFDGEWHRSRNKVVLPDAHCTIRIANTGLTTVQSRVSGLEVDVDADIVSYVYALTDVYRLSHQRFAKYADELPGNTSIEVPMGSNSDPFRHSQSEPRRIHADFTFASGVIRAHSGESVAATPEANAATGRPRHQRRGHSVTDFTGLHRHAEHAMPETPPDVFHLPALSVWAHLEDDVQNIRAMSPKAHIDIVIHQSSNILYPSLLPFISNVVRQVKKRQTVADLSALNTPAIHEQKGPDAPVVQSVPAQDASSNLRLSVSLRIDESKLEISCMPAAEVVGQISWDSGGFLLTLAPRSGDITLTATIDGVSATLRHLFSPEDCIRAETRGLAVAASWARPDEAESKRILSVLVRVPDTSVAVNMRHLQDWLCLKAIWIDHLDFGESGPTQRTSDHHTMPASTESSPTLAASPIETLVRLESGRCTLSCDLGPAIGKWSITAKDFATRLCLQPSSTREVAISLGEIRIAGQGRAGGILCLSGLAFSTRLRDGQCTAGDKLPTSDLLHIEIALGAIDAAIEHDFHRILVFASDPLRVSVGDDWSQAREADPKLQLGFRVRAGSLQLISTTATVPILLGISRRINALLEEKSSAAAASLAAAGFKARESSSVKAAAAVSNVASIFGREQNSGISARTCPVRIVNKLSIEIDSLRLAVFADHWNDGEVYRADAGASIRAELKRGVDANQVIQRTLRLHLGFFSIRKVNHRKVSPSQGSEFDVTRWYDYLRNGSERNIFKIGTTDVAMDSEQVVGSNRLKHRFSMQFGGHVDVALNYALFRNLVTLSTQYQLQLDRVMGPAPESAGSLKQSARDGGTPLLAPSAVLPAAVDETKTTILRPELPSPEGEVVRMKPLPAIQASTAERRALEFEAIEMEVHQPQLQVLGDATPPLEWLGLQRDRFPAFVHTGVTSPLEELLIVLSSTYSSQLARTRFSEAQPAPGEPKST